MPEPEVTESYVNGRTISDADFARYMSKVSLTLLDPWFVRYATLSVGL